MRLTLSVTLIVLAIACSPRSGIQSVSDRDGNTYPFVRMQDGKLWTARNLNSNLTGSYCYDSLQQNCEKYGRLYTWPLAQSACAELGSDWRLPSNDDWRNLVKHYGGIVGEPGDGTHAYEALTSSDSTNFITLLGGGRDPGGSYRRIDAHGFYWTATDTDSTHAWLYNFAKGPGLLNAHPDIDKGRAASVRCIKD